MLYLLNSLNCGICINNCNYNVFAYADDLLLSSTTVTGLEQLIDTAVSYVTDQILRFNLDKTKCLLFGANPFDTIPNWKMNNTSLSVDSNLTYLGAEIGSNSGRIPIEKRLRCAQRAFYSLQGSGLNFQGVLPETAMSIFKTVKHITLSKSVKDGVDGIVDSLLLFRSYAPYNCNMTQCPRHPKLKNGGPG